MSNWHHRRHRSRHSRNRFLRWFLYILTLLAILFFARLGCQKLFQQKALHSVSPPGFDDLSSFSDKQQSQLTRWLKVQVSSGAFPSLSVSVSRSHGMVYASALGRSGRNDPVLSTYPLGAVSKPLSIAALMSFVESGQIDLDAPISTYLADYRISDSITYENSITPRLLATHLSGLPRDGIAPQPPFNGEAIPFYEQLPLLKMRHRPGAKRSYSNLAYGLLELSMMNVAKKSFSTIIKDRVFDPLGMSHAYVLKTASPSEADSLTAGYHCAQRCSAIESMDWSQFGAASNGVAASAHDMSLFLTAMLQEDKSAILNPTSLQLTRRSEALSVGDNAGLLTRNTIMWRKKEIEGVGWAYRALGGLHGSSAAIYLMPEHDIAVAVLSNRNLTVSGEGDVAEIAEIILQKSIVSEAKPQ